MRSTIVFCVLAALCEGIDLQAAGVAAGGIALQFTPTPGQFGASLQCQHFRLVFRRSDRRTSCRQHRPQESLGDLRWTLRTLLLVDDACLGCAIAQLGASVDRSRRRPTDADCAGLRMQQRQATERERGDGLCGSPPGRRALESRQSDDCRASVAIDLHRRWHHSARARASDGLRYRGIGRLPSGQPHRSRRRPPASRVTEAG